MATLRDPDEVVTGKGKLEPVKYVNSRVLNQLLHVCGHSICSQNLVNSRTVTRELNQLKHVISRVLNQLIHVYGHSICPHNLVNSPKETRVLTMIFKIHYAGTVHVGLCNILYS